MKNIVVPACLALLGVCAIHQAFTSILPGDPINSSCLTLVTFAAISAALMWFKGLSDVFLVSTTATSAALVTMGLYAISILGVRDLQAQLLLVFASAGLGLSISLCATMERETPLKKRWVIAVMLIHVISTVAVMIVPTLTLSAMVALIGCVGVMSSGLLGELYSLKALES